jgi:hypothetical protein
MVRRLLKKTSEARRAINRSFGLAQDRLPSQVRKSKCWINASLHYSIIPLLQSLLRWSEAIERNEAYESFSADCSANLTDVFLT